MGKKRTLLLFQAWNIFSSKSRIEDQSYQGTGVLVFLFKSTVSFMTLTLLYGLPKYFLVKETHDKNI